MSPTSSRRDDRGAVFPSPVVMLSILAVVMAGIAFVATRDEEPTERKVSAVAQDPTGEETTGSAGSTDPTTTADSGDSGDSSDDPSDEPTEQQQQTKKPEPKPIDRGATYVIVYNNSGITGLAGRVADQAATVGWNVVGADNWYGTIPDNTVYFPQPLQREAEQLALDLGIDRTAPAVDPMQLDRLTVILTGEL
jgi:hypothetical protein